MKKLLMTMLFVSLFFIFGCSDDVIYFETCGSLIPNNNKSTIRSTRGTVWFGQYISIGDRYSRGGCNGAMYRFDGAPDGEIIAVWKTYERDLKSKVLSGTEKYYYAYDPDPDYNLPLFSRIFHQAFSINMTYGYLGLDIKASTRKQIQTSKVHTARNGTRKLQVGKPNFFYFLAKSDYYNGNVRNEFLAAPLNEYGKIEGIEISQAQFQYLFRLNSKPYLHEATNITLSQEKYMKQRGKNKK
jgi:hypothetical protein